MDNLLKTTAVYIAIDAVYLGILQRKKMQRFFQQVNCGKPWKLNALLGIAAWILLAFGLEKFVFPVSKTKKQAVINASLLGLVIYGVYDATNWATIRAWTPQFAITDVLWGMFLGGLVAFIRYRH